MGVFNYLSKFIQNLIKIFLIKEKIDAKKNSIFNIKHCKYTTILIYDILLKKMVDI